MYSKVTVYKGKIISWFQFSCGKPAVWQIPMRAWNDDLVSLLEKEVLDGDKENRQLIQG
jgi:hypothetical protein